MRIYEIPRLACESPEDVIAHPSLLRSFARAPGSTFASDRSETTLEVTH